MKNFSLLLITLFINLSTIQIFAQKESIPREVIIVEFINPSGMLDKSEVLINQNARTNYETFGGGGDAGFAGCWDCSKEKSEKINREYKEELKKFSYDFTARARQISKNVSRLSFTISFGDGTCQTKTKFLVYRNKRKKLLLKCGVNLTAYYSVEGKEAN